MVAEQVGAGGPVLAARREASSRARFWCSCWARSAQHSAMAAVCTFCKRGAAARGGALPRGGASRRATPWWTCWARSAQHPSTRSMPAGCMLFCKRGAAARGDAAGGRRGVATRHYVVDLLGAKRPAPIYEVDASWRHVFLQARRSRAWKVGTCCVKSGGAFRGGSTMTSFCLNTWSSTF